MAKRSREPLELGRREIRFFQGDWERLSEILSPFRIANATFIRELLRKQLRQIEEHVNASARPVMEPINVGALISSIPPDDDQSGEPSGPVQQRSEEVN